MSFLLPPTYADLLISIVGRRHQSTRISSCLSARDTARAFLKVWSFQFWLAATATRSQLRIPR